MKKLIVFLCLLSVSNTILATRTCSPDGNCSSTAADLLTEEPIYYPPQNNNDSPTNPGIQVAPEPESTGEN